MRLINIGIGSVDPTAGAVRSNAMAASEWNDDPA